MITAAVLNFFFNIENAIKQADKIDYSNKICELSLILYFCEFVIN
jgi:hypothetical protein